MISQILKKYKERQQDLSSKTTQNVTVTRIIHGLGWKKPRRKDIRLTMLYKIINEIANVPKKEILISADTTTGSKYGHTFYIMTKNTNIHKHSFFSQTLELAAKSISW